MTRTFSCFVAALLMAPVMHAQTPVNTSNVPSTEGSAVKTVTVPAEGKLREILGEVQQLHAKHRFFDALQKLSEAEALAPENPMIYNIRGSVYTGMRDFEKAQIAFAKAHELLPDSFEPDFNLAELFYVQEKYAEAETAFAKLLEKHVKIREDVRHLTIFKIIICELKQNKTAEAEKNAKTFTFMDDTPAYYFTKAAFAFQNGKQDEARDWLNKAGNIFKQGQNPVYVDSLMEAKWIPSLTVPDEGKELK
jgi:tetratricopeptide (TPR) repeat protein